MCNNSFAESVVIPAVQAVITGGLAGFAVGSAAGLAGAPSPLQLGLTAGSLAGLAAWLRYRGRWQYILERFLQVDINQDGVIGQPEELSREPVRVELIQDQGKRGDYIDLPARPEQLRVLADGLTYGKTFSQSVWTGNGAPFSRSEFEALRAELLRRGLARWRKEGAPGQGIELTSPGRAVIRRFATTTARLSPPLLADDRRE